MLGRFQLFSLAQCFRLGFGACCYPNQKFPAQTIRPPDLRSLGQAVSQNFNFAKDVLDQWSQLEKDGLREPYPALWEVSAKGEEDKWSSERMTQLSKKTASILSDTCALSHGDRLMIILPPTPEAYWICLACVHLGITFQESPLSPKLTAKKIRYQLHMSKAQCIVANEAMAPVVNSAMSDCPTLKTKVLVSDKSYDGWLDFKKLIQVAPPKQTCVRTKSQDLMAIFFTEGTTGAPKMAEYSQYGLGMGFSQTSRQWMDLQLTDVLWSLGDAFGGSLSLSNVLEAWLQGACLFLCRMPTFCPETVLNVLSRFPITTLSANPEMYHKLLHYRFKSLKHYVAAGGCTSPGVIKDWKRTTKLNIYEGYGQTETGLLCATSKIIKLKPGSLGKPLPPYIVQIVDENLNIFKCRFLDLSFYQVSWEEYASARGHMLYLTGGRGIMDEDSYFWLSGRADDVANPLGQRL
uniref:medium-chain acyl-CoA ligase n=1 Tax=Cebus imitator TaxID=2715852 RepID=A0A2K5RC34_CEBIM